MQEEKSVNSKIKEIILSLNRGPEIYRDIEKKESSRITQIQVE